jgi:hypothetical protein
MRIFSVIDECEGKDLAELEGRVNEKRTSGGMFFSKIFAEPD